MIIIVAIVITATTTTAATTAAVVATTTTTAAELFDRCFVAACTIFTKKLRFFTDHQKDVCIVARQKIFLLKDFVQRSIICMLLQCLSVFFN